MEKDIGIFEKNEEESEKIYNEKEIDENKMNEKEIEKDEKELVDNKNINDLTKDERIHFRNGVLSIIGASILNFVYPSCFAFCTLVVYQTSYVYCHGGNVRIVHTIFYYPVLLFFQSIFGLIAGIIYSKIEVHWSNFLGTVLLVLGGFIMYLSATFVLDMVSMAIFGIAIAIIMFPATTNACKYFMKRIGLVNGIVETFISLGSSVFAFIGEWVINPNNDESEENSFYKIEIAEKVKTFLLIQIFCFIGSFLLGLLFIKKYNEDKETENKEEILLDKPINGETKIRNANKRKIKIIKALKSWTFWRYNLISLSQSPVSDMIFAMYRGIGEDKNVNEKVLQLIGTLTFIIEFILSFVFGVLCDYVDFRILLFTMNIIGTVVGFIYCLTFHNNFFFALSTLLIAVQSAAYYSLKDYHLMKVFGTEIYVDLSGFICLSTGIVVLALSFVTYWIEEECGDKDLAYWIIFPIFGAINGGGVILGFFEKDDPFDYGEDE